MPRRRFSTLGQARERVLPRACRRAVLLPGWTSQGMVWEVGDMMVGIWGVYLESQSGAGCGGDAFFVIARRVAAKPYSAVLVVSEELDCVASLAVTARGWGPRENSQPRHPGPVPGSTSRLGSGPPVDAGTGPA